MRRDFVKALHDASQRESIDDRVESIKLAVSKEVRAADPAVFIRHTSYFNHVAVPDMVLRWPNEERERLLFLRPTADPRWLLSDITGGLSAHRPMIFTLEDAEIPEVEAQERAVEELAAAASREDALVAGPSAIEEVATARSASSVGGLLGQALVRGGRGVVSEASVQQLSQSTESAFEGAAEQDGDKVALTIHALEGALAPEQAGRITRVLRAVWEGHGGAASAFPTVASTGPLSNDDLTYLLLSLDDAPAEFWSRVGKGIATSQIGNLDLPDPSKSLQLFVSANMEALSAKGLRVLPQQTRLGESEEFPRWSVERGCLALRGTEWTAYIAARKAEELPPPSEGKSPSFEALRARVKDSRAVLTKVQFGKGDRAMTYESKDRLNVSGDEDLARMAQQVKGLAIEEASIAVAGGAVNLDFGSSTGLGPTSSSLPLGPLLRSALPLLVSMQPGEAVAVAEIVSPSNDGTLFDGQPMEAVDADDEVEFQGPEIEVDEDGGAIVQRPEDFDRG